MNPLNANAPVLDRTTAEPALAVSSPQRSCHLDFLRAAAIAVVVFFHLFRMSPTPFPGFMRYARAGQYGVDLFFVLSGWLIGNLYWREHARFGNVALARFWTRRWLRTIPPYLVALALSWLAVKVERGAPLDFGYFIFIQNYYHTIPFFLVSWSLCVEEHFYLFLPLLLLVVVRSRLALPLFFSTLILGAFVCRCFTPVGEVHKDFGFWVTATHLRMEGLLLGFWASHMLTLQPKAWSMARRVSPYVSAFGAVVVACCCFVPERWMYRVGLSALAFGLCGVVVWMTDRKPGVIVGSPLVRWIALASYSVYLTHPLMLHVARKAAAAIPAWQTWLYFPTALALIAVAGAGFYFAVERTSIQVRDRWAPRRARNLNANPESASSHVS
jgi:peptidoglycan/LPS O-acetylase OafA/YrhL